MLWQDLPGFHAAQNSFFAVYLPYGCRLPAQTLADSLEDSRACTCQGWGFGQHARDGVLSGQARLLALARRDVARNCVNDSFFRAYRASPAEPLIGTVFALETVLEDKGIATCRQTVGFGDGRFTIFGVNEIHIGSRQQLLLAVAERFFPRGVEVLEVTVNAGNTQHVDRQVEKLSQVVFSGRIETRCGGHSAWGLMLVQRFQLWCKEGIHATALMGCTSTARLTLLSGGRSMAANR